MFFDLNVPVPTPDIQLPNPTKKSKQKQNQQRESTPLAAPPLVFTPAQIAGIEARIDLLVHLGYTVLALNQEVQSKVDARTHVDWLQGLVPKLRKRRGIAVLTRLTVVLDEESDKGHGINPQNAALLAPYDILAVHPTTPAAFSQACLAHSVPSPHTVHIISLPVTLPRLPFHLKHTLVRTALRNGAVFEVAYAGAVAAAEGERRSWWGAGREVVRVTGGRGLLVCGGAAGEGLVRAPRDVVNLITLLGVAQDVGRDAVAGTAKAVVLRAQSRKTYRATLSEPKLVFPASAMSPAETEDRARTMEARGSTGETRAPEAESALRDDVVGPPLVVETSSNPVPRKQGKKRQREDCQREDGQHSGGGKKRKKKG